MKPWLTMREAVYLTEVPRSTIQDWASSGLVITRKVMLGKKKYRIEFNTRELLQAESVRHAKHTLD